MFKYTRYVFFEVIYTELLKQFQSALHNQRKALQCDIFAHTQKCTSCSQGTQQMVSLNTNSY